MKIKMLVPGHGPTFEAAAGDILTVGEDIGKDDATTLLNSKAAEEIAEAKPATKKARK